jgi:uncharacterized protein YjbJ (UPF0337 family)
MDRDRVEGSAKTFVGRIKDLLGSLIGDSKLQVEGKIDQAEGRFQNTVGGVKDALRDDNQQR